MRMVWRQVALLRLPAVAGSAGSTISRLQRRNIFQAPDDKLVSPERPDRWRHNGHSRSEEIEWLGSIGTYRAPRFPVVLPSAITVAVPRMITPARCRARNDRRIAVRRERISQRPPVLGVYVNQFDIVAGARNNPEGLSVGELLSEFGTADKCWPLV